ncbi:alpha-(1,3)-fucosyltransferase 7 [Lampetra planeri]
MADVTRDDRGQRASPLRGDECLGVSPRCLLSQDARLLPSADAVVFLHRHVRRDLANLPLGPSPPPARASWWPGPCPTGAPRLAATPTTASWRSTCACPCTAAAARPCPDSPRRRRGGGTAPVLSRYLFYLAFENARSPHYVTEKLWANALGSAAAVPVALGPPRADYERATLPPAAFLHVDDFASPRELALRLRALAADGAAYGRMHAWRRRYRVRSARGWDERLCAVCRRLGRSGGVVEGGAARGDIAEWFAGGD